MGDTVRNLSWVRAVVNRRIYLIDYGLGGNLGSIKVALKRVSKCVEVISKPIQEPEKEALVILPGVGNFSAVIKSLERSGLSGWLGQVIKYEDADVLGICIGMHILFERSLEGDDVRGLGVLPGHVAMNKRIEKIEKYPLNVGWKKVQFCENSRFRKRSGQSSEFYFDHKYSVECESRLVAGKQCDQQFNIAALVECENIIGVQFHPEISGRAGHNFFKSVIDVS